MSKELTVVQGGDLVELDETEVGGSGLENVDQKDQLIPRLQIAAGTSKQLLKGNEKYIPGLGIGDMFNTVTGQVYGDSVTVVPVWFSKNRILFDKDNKQECRSDNAIDGGHLSELCANCEFSQWGTGKNDKGTACLEFRNFAVMVIDEHGMPELVSVSMKSTSAGMAKKWVNMIEARRAKSGGQVVKMPMYRGTYTLSKAAKEGERGAFYVWTVNNKGVVTDPKLLETLRKVHDQFRNADLALAASEVAADE